LTSKEGKFQINFDIKSREKLVKVYNTTDKSEIIKLIRQRSLMTDQELLVSLGITETKTIKEQIAEADLKIKNAKAERIKERESLSLREQEARTELLERQLNYSHTFNSEPSSQAKSSMRKGIQRKYSNYDYSNITETIQKKKNFFINKITDSEYCGVCKVCQNFTTDICITSHEPQGDIELHLESIHNTELYQR